MSFFILNISWDIRKSVSHVTRLTCMCDMTRSFVWHDSFRRVNMRHFYAWKTHQVMWDVSMWHDLRMCVTWLFHVCGVTHSCVWHDSFMCVAWLIDMCDMTHAFVWHNSLICVAWLILMCEHETFLRVKDSWSNEGCIYVTWLAYVCDVTHSCVWPDSFICVAWLAHMSERLIQVTVTHSYVWHDAFICAT